MYYYWYLIYIYDKDTYTISSTRYHIPINIFEIKILYKYVLIYKDMYL